MEYRCNVGPKAQKNCDSKESKTASESNMPNAVRRLESDILSRLLIVPLATLAKYFAVAPVKPSLPDARPKPDSAIKQKLGKWTCEAPRPIFIHFAR